MNLNTPDSEAAIESAIDRAAKEFRERGELTRLIVLANPASGKFKVTPYDDCEDGMQSYHWHIK